MRPARGGRRKYFDRLVRDFMGGAQKNSLPDAPAVHWTLVNDEPGYVWREREGKDAR